MKKDKIQEAYNKILKEATNLSQKHMGKANNAMADFLMALEDSMPEEKGDKKIWKQFKEIDNGWEKLWDKIVALTRKL